MWLGHIFREILMEFQGAASLTLSSAQQRFVAGNVDDDEPAGNFRAFRVKETSANRATRKGMVAVSACY
jgi:hypothetical protein